MEALSHPARLQFLCKVLGGGRGAQQLVLDAGRSQPAMSHHLNKLRGSGLVLTRRSKQTFSYILKGRMYSRGSPPTLVQRPNRLSLYLSISWTFFIQYLVI